MNLQEWLDQSKSVVFFGGAGVSTESGIPDFRSTDGLYNQKFEIPPETILSHDFYVKNPEIFYDFYKTKMLCLNARPNNAHHFLYRLELSGKLNAIITQNIDGLHQQAGNKHVLELHGSINRNFCLKCGKNFDASFMKKATGIPTCSCGGMLKPDVVLYGESLKSEVIEQSIQAIQQADLLIVAGTSLTVYPAATFLRYFQGKALILINRDKTPYDSFATLVIREPVGEVLGKLCIKESKPKP